MQITLDNSIETVLFNNVDIETVVFNNNVVWEKSPSSPVGMFNFTGIDANGNFETDVYNYDGTAVEYAIGIPQIIYTYQIYTEVVPTPTEESDYSNKYVYNENTEDFVLYSSSLSWVVIGTTPCYTTSTSVSFVPRYEFNYIYVSSEYSSQYNQVNSGLNSSYFNNYDFRTEYSAESNIPDLGIETIIIPNKYNGKPVTRILRRAFIGIDRISVGAQAFDEVYYAPYKIKNFTLNSNMLYLELYALNGICRIPTNNNAEFNFNSNIQSLEDGSIGVYNYETRNVNSIIRLPSSVTFVSANIARVGATNSVRSDKNNHVYKLIISSPTITCATLNISSLNTSSGVADYADYVVFERTVQNISGVLQQAATSSEYTKFIVFKHSQNDQVTINVSNNKSAVACTIYTDCDAVKNYDWASQNYTVTFKPLSEYEGD